MYCYLKLDANCIHWFYTCIRHNANKVETNLVFPQTVASKPTWINEISILWGTEREREIHYWLSSKAHLLPPSLQSQLVLRCVHFSGSWCFLFTKQIKAGPSLRIVISSRLHSLEGLEEGMRKREMGRGIKEKGLSIDCQILFHLPHIRNVRNRESMLPRAILQDAFNCIGLLISREQSRGLFLFGYILSPHQVRQQSLFLPRATFTACFLNFRVCQRHREQGEREQSGLWFQVKARHQNVCGPHWPAYRKIILKNQSKKESSGQSQSERGERERRMETWARDLVFPNFVPHSYHNEQG